MGRKAAGYSGRAANCQAVGQANGVQSEAAADAAYFDKYGRNEPNPVLEWVVSKQNTPADARPLSRLTIAQGRLVASVLKMGVIPQGESALEIIDRIRSELASHPAKRRLVVQDELYDLIVAPALLKMKTGDRRSLFISNPEDVPIFFWMKSKSTFYTMDPDHAIIPPYGTQCVKIVAVRKPSKHIQLCIRFGLVDAGAATPKDALDMAVKLDERIVELRQS